MRVAYLIITSDYDVDERELAEFRRLCGLLELEHDEVWRDSKIWSEAARVSDGGLVRLGALVP
jgi:hypothetical protein